MFGTNPVEIGRGDICETVHTNPLTLATVGSGYSTFHHCRGQFHTVRVSCAEEKVVTLFVTPFLVLEVHNLAVAV